MEMYHNFNSNRKFVKSLEDMTRIAEKNRKEALSFSHADNFEIKTKI